MKNEPMYKLLNVVDVPYGELENSMNDIAERGYCMVNKIVTAYTTILVFEKMDILSPVDFSEVFK